MNIFDIPVMIGNSLAEARRARLDRVIQEEELRLIEIEGRAKIYEALEKQVREQRARQRRTKEKRRKYGR